MRRYKLRAECKHDVDQFINIAGNIADIIEIESIESIPDVNLTFETELQTIDLFEMISQLDCCHVMMQTLQPIEIFTGERIYDRDYDIEFSEQIDLFEHFETLPKSVQNLINKEVETYDQCDQLLKKLKQLGYTFEYGLDAIPFNLRKI